jgi:hypothetical protein
MKSVKVILGTIAVTGTLSQGIELYYHPDVLLLESSKPYPEFLYWLRWIVTLIAVVGYLVIDYKEHSKRK